MYFRVSIIKVYTSLKFNVAIESIVQQVESTISTCLIFSPPGTSTQKNETYSLKQLNDQVYDEATSTAPNYSSLGPGYDVVVSKRDIFDVTDHDQSEASKPQAPDSPTPVREETSKKEDDFYDVEEHTCSVVNKKKAKTTSEDGEGEREEPLDYEMAVPGETSWGGMDEGYF